MAEETQPDSSPKPEEPTGKPKKKKPTAKTYAVRFFTRIGLTVLIVWGLLTFVCGIYVNHENNSYPMLKDGDFCLTYKLDALKQGDVVAYHSGESVRFGRVIALSGDTVEVKDDYIAVNGYGIFDETVYPTTAEGAAIDFPYTVPENSVFVLNDFRSDTSDSRTSGGISLDECEGKLVFIMRRRGF